MKVYNDYWKLINLLIKKRAELEALQAEVNAMKITIKTLEEIK